MKSGATDADDAKGGSANEAPPEVALETDARLSTARTSSEQEATEAKRPDQPPEAETASAILRVTRKELEDVETAAELVVVQTACSGGAKIVLPRSERLAVAVDLTMDPVRTDFLSAAEAAGWTTVSGVSIQLQMLIMAFQRWTGTDPDEQIMREALEEFLLV